MFMLKNGNPFSRIKISQKKKKITSFPLRSILQLPPQSLRWDTPTCYRTSFADDYPEKNPSRGSVAKWKPRYRYHSLSADQNINLQFAI